MKNRTSKLLCFERVAVIIAILISLVIITTPVSASTCNQGFIVIYPSSSPIQYSQSSCSSTFITSLVSNKGGTIQYSQPSFSSNFIASPVLNPGATIQFYQPSFSSSVPVFLVNGKGYSSINAF